MSKELKKHYKKLHWGESAAKVIELSDDFPDRSVEMGKLSEIRLAPLSEALPGETEEAWAIEVEPEKLNYHRLLVDFDHPHDRLYLKMTADSKKDAQKLWKDSPVHPMPLATLSYWAGGHHAGDDYRDILVKPLGRITHLVYVTIKSGDGLSYYVHEMGEEWEEEEGIRPILAVSKDGQLWIAGGSYECPSPGIIR